MGVEWVHRDPVVKSQRLTDEAGNVVAVIELDPSGGETDRCVNQRQQPYRYTTYERDGNGVDRAVMRSYHGWWTRFNEPDPWDGSYDLTDPQSFNRYTYVQNDPVNFVDPSGLFALNREYFEAMEALWELWLFGMQMNQRLVQPLVDGPELTPDGGGGGAPALVPQQSNPTPCDVRIPDDPNLRAAIGTILGEATLRSYIGMRQCRDGDTYGRPTGEVITEENLYTEAILMASVIVNRANRSGQSLQDVVSARG